MTRPLLASLPLGTLLGLGQLGLHAITSLVASLWY